MCFLPKYNLEKAARISGNNCFFLIERTLLEFISKLFGQNVGLVLLKLEGQLLTDVGRKFILFTLFV
jgi:hypothetical protein